MSTETPELERLRSWKVGLELRLSELDRSVKPLLVEIEKVKQQLELVQKLLRLESGEESPATTELEDSTPRREGETSGSSVADILAGILKDAAGPLHISELKERFLGMGRRIPGKGTESNLISYLLRDPRFVRQSKGTYMLVATSGEAHRVPRGLRTRRRRRRRGPSR